MDISIKQHKQQGSMLLEALISILIFSMGILAIVGLQANSIKMSSDAKYRSDASMLANQYVALMWADVASAVIPANTPFNNSQFVNFASPSGANFTPWLNTIQANLPNATATVLPVTTLNPGIAVAGAQQSTSTAVTIQINWQLPGGEAHSYSTTALITAQKTT
jgi:type IV pilus assembly protein PilV